MQWTMQTVSLIWGILSIVGMLIGFLPCFGVLNWLNIPFAGLGIAFSAVALGTSDKESKGNSTAGLICCVCAVLFGGMRLILGSGVL